jgi:hypothetical protein
MTFVIGFVLGTLVGGGGVAALLAVLGGDDEAEVAVAHAPPVHPAPPAPVAAPEPPPPPPAPVEVAPEPAPAPRPAARPAPAAKPAPAPAPKPTVAMNKSPTGFAFVGKDGKRYTPDAVPPGDYEILADWGSGLERSGNVTVQEGKAVKIVCDPPTKSCRVK